MSLMCLKMFCFQGMCFLLFSLATATIASAAQLSIDVQAHSAILINAETGAILYEKNAYEPLHPASITKIATALYALTVAENRLDTLIEADHDAIASLSQEAKRQANYTMPAWWLEPGGTHIGIKKGEQLTLRDLLYGTMLASANDAANVVAKYVGGTIPQFITELNTFMRSLGMKQTVFVNPHGLHHPNHKTTAYDMSLLAQAALKNPTFCTIVATTRYTRPKTNKQEPSVLIQGNELVRTGKRFYYPKAIGIKTGYISSAQNTLVAAAREKDRTLVAVLLKNKERPKMFSDAVKMFEMAFNQPKVRRQLIVAGPQPYEFKIAGARRVITTYASRDLSIEYYPAEEPQLRCFLLWNELALPVAQDQPVGELRFFDGEKLAYSEQLFARETLTASWLAWMPAPSLKQVGAIATLLIVGLCLYLFFRR